MLAMKSVETGADKCDPIIRGSSTKDLDRLRKISNYYKPGTFYSNTNMFLLHSLGKDNNLPALLLIRINFA